MGDTLETLLAKQAITEQIVNYCRAMDRIDDDLGYSVFHPDAVADYGPIFQGSGYGFVDFVHDNHSAMLVQSHNISNIAIRIDSETTAGSEAYVVATLRMKGEGDAVMQIQTLGRYIDQWEKRDGAWRIARREYLPGMDEIRPVASPSLYPIGGARDRTDPSYARLGTVDQVPAA